MFNRVNFVIICFWVIYYFRFLCVSVYGWKWGCHTPVPAPQECTLLLPRYGYHSFLPRTIKADIKCALCPICILKLTFRGWRSTKQLNGIGVTSSNFKWSYTHSIQIWLLLLIIWQYKLDTENISYLGFDIERRRKRMVSLPRWVSTLLTLDSSVNKRASKITQNALVVAPHSCCSCS